MNPLQQWLEQHTTGPGAWKWTHYLEVYHTFLAKFRNQPVTVCEIGVYSGGSLRMWRDYFGPRAQIIGVDIQPACKKYEDERICIEIGDQGDREFWKQFKEKHPRLDAVIDDGSHDPEHQITTMNELLPHLAPGGVYLCEDVLLGQNTGFANYVSGMTIGLHENVDIHATDMLAMGLSDLQKTVKSIHTYAHVVVLEKWDTPPERFEAPGYGSEWIWTDPGWKP